MNVHKRCQKNVANNCGINTKEMAEILNAIGVNTKINQRKKKVSTILLTILLCWDIFQNPVNFFVFKGFYYRVDRKWW